MTDAYQGYNAVTGVTHCFCLAHCRRYWHNALPKNKEGSKAKIGLDYCDKLFHLEKRWANLTPEKRHRRRNRISRKVLEEYFAWVESLDVLAGSNLGKAVQYSLNNKEGLMGYLSDGHVEISNNRIESNIRKFVIGRNNFIAVDTVAGAKASAVCYSMVITAQDSSSLPTNAGIGSFLFALRCNSAKQWNSANQRFASSLHKFAYNLLCKLAAK